MKSFDPSPPRLLIADDQPDILESLRLLLKAEGFEIHAENSPQACLVAVEKRDFDAALIDLNYTRDTTSGQEGLDLVERLQSLDSTLPVIVMTAWASIDVAVEAMRRGARDFVQKPWENARLLSVLRNQIELSRALRRGAQLEAENCLLRAEGLPTLIAESAAMRPVQELIARVGPSDANVLITGEHGTGKEVVARTLHSISARAARPMVTVNMGGLAEGVLESELFGHVKGAFTDARADRVGRFELADGGTLFLDEIANMPMGQQARLLRVIESGEFERVGSSKTRRVNARLLSATNASPEEEVRFGRFREDVLFRLNTVEIHLPPLRQRGEDIPVLANFFLRQHARRYQKRVSSFDEPAMRALHSNPWPGNVRELDHVVERAVLLAQGEAVSAAAVSLRPAHDAPARLEEMNLEEVERLLVQKALERFQGNVTEAAHFLGLSRSGLYRRLQKHGL